MKSWLETFPHKIYVTAFLNNGKLFDYRIGEFPKHAMSMTIKNNFDKFTGVKVVHKEFTVNSSQEHNDVFQLYALDWLDTSFEKDEGFVLENDILTKRKIPKILEFLKSNNLNFSEDLINDFKTFLLICKDNNFVSDNNLEQFVGKYKTKLEDTSLTDYEVIALGRKINDFYKLKKILKLKNI